MNLFKLRKGQGLYDIAKKSYDVVYNNIMSRGRIHQIPTFLGNSSTVLEREHFSGLVQNDYLVSLRASKSESFLMLIGETDENNSEARYIFFVDAELSYWVMEDLPSISGCAQMLFDGELFSRDGGFVFNACDLLYGPSTPTFEDETSRLKLNLGASFAMIGPKANARWPFYKRYDVLKKVVLNEYSPIYQYTAKPYPSTLRVDLQNSNIGFSIAVNPYFSVKELFSKSNDVREAHNHIAKQSKLPKDSLFVFTKNSDLCGENKTLIAAKDSNDLKLLCVVFKPMAQWGAVYKTRILKQLMGTTFEHRCRLIRNPCEFAQSANVISKGKFAQSANEPSFAQSAVQKLIEQYGKDQKIETKIFVSEQQRCILFKFFKELPNITESVVHYYTAELPKAPSTKRNQEVRITYGILGAHRIKDEIVQTTELAQIAASIDKKYGYAAKPITYVINEFALHKYDPRNGPQRYRYQKKYEINGMPENHTPNILWRLDITLYGESTVSEDLAKDNFTNDPKTEISVIYAPGEQESNALAYYNLYPNERTLQQMIAAFSLHGSPSTVLQMLNERIRKLKNLPINVIMQDYCRTIVWILNTLF
jgi:hypothetical protein